MEFPGVAWNRASLRSWIKLLLVMAIPSFVLTSCILPGTRSTKTPELTGRIVDSQTHQPVTNATLQFVQIDRITPFKKPVAVTGTNGFFKIAGTWNHNLGGIVIPHGFSAVWPPEKTSVLLRIEHEGYVKRDVDLQAAFQTSQYADNHKFMGMDLICFEKEFPIGDMPLEPVKVETNRVPEGI